MSDKTNFAALTECISWEQPEVLVECMQKIMETSTTMMFIKDTQLRYLAASPVMAAVAGKDSPAELLGKTALEVFEDRDLGQRYTADDERLLATGQGFFDYIERIPDENGEERYASLCKYVIRGKDGSVIGILGIAEDVTHQLRAYQQYGQVMEHLFSLPDDAMATISIDVTDWHIMAQHKQEDMYMPAYASVDEFKESILNSIGERDEEAHQFYQQFSPIFLQETYEQGKSEFAIEHPNTLPDGAVLWARDEWKLLTDPQNSHLIATLLVKDIHARKQEEFRLRQAARNDELTGLYNRVALKEEVDAYLAEEGAGGNHAAFVVDLDDFKSVNDTFGHQAGDLLLCEIAANITECFRDADLVGRISGGAFFVLAKNVPSQKIARNRAKRLLDALCKVYASQTTAIGFVSIGVSLYPADGQTMDELYKKADTAMYKAKSLGENRVAFTTDDVPQWSTNVLDKRYDAYNSKVVDLSNSICYISDLETYELLHLTKAGMEMYGMNSPDEYRGKKCYQVIVGLDEPCHFCTNNKITEGMEYRWERYNESINKWFDCTSAIIHLDGRPCHLETAHDITDRKEEISLLSGKLTMEDVLFRCLHTLTNEKEAETAFHLFLEAVGGFYQASRAYIFEIDNEKQVLSNTFEWCAAGVSAEIGNLQQLPLEMIDDWIRKFQTDGGFIINSLDKDVRPNTKEYRILEMQGVKSMMAVPMWENGNVAGFIGVDDPIQNQGILTLLHSVAEFVQAELERRHLTENLAVALEKANVANRSKSKFLFNMSHDIRTPMNAIMGFSMMAEKHIDEKERVLDCLAKLSSAGKHLQRLINDVLDMSRIESGKMTFDYQPQHLPTLLKDTWEMFNAEMQKKDITFNVSWELEDEIVLLDRLRMDQVELNLVSNALKYTPEGGRVDYTIRQIGKTADGKGIYQGCVKDTGIGMSEEFAARVFEPFEREKTSTVNGIQGTGLGMSITKSLIDQMGGTITCNSKQGEGTEFIYTVAFQIVAEEALPKKVEDLTAKSSFTEKRILLVEDNELNREIAVEILEEFGFIMESAEDGDIAVDMVKKSEPGYYDLILMDVQMPRMDGYTATQEIRALENKALAGIPIVAMTANAFAEDRQDALAAGMNDHVAKPIDVPKLLQVLQQIL